MTQGAARWIISYDMTSFNLNHCLVLLFKGLCSMSVPRVAKVRRDEWIRKGVTNWQVPQTMRHSALLQFLSTIPETDITS